MFPSILSGFLMRCSKPEKEKYSTLFFNQQEYQIVKQVIDILIPSTSTKSASEANVQDFLDEVFAKCLTEDQQTLVREGIGRLQSEFTEADDKQAFLAEADQKAYEQDENYAFLKTIKQYTLVGFFTSQEGETKASNYVKFPGDYQGEIQLDENTLNYGETSLRFYLW